MKVLYTKTDVDFLTFLLQLFLELEPLQTKCLDKIHTHFMFNERFRQSCCS